MLIFDLQTFKGGSSSSTTTTIKQRDLTQEEKDLIKLQAQYVRNIQPALNQLINFATDTLKNVINVDWKANWEEAIKAFDIAKEKMDQVSDGILPSSFVSNKIRYYDQIYDSTFGNSLVESAQKGVINSSTLNKSLDSMQKDIVARMSQDWSNDLQLQTALISNQLKLAGDKFNLAGAAQQGSMYYPSTMLGLATGQNAAGNQTLSTIGGLMNNATFIEAHTTSKSSGGGLFGF